MYFREFLKLLRVGRAGQGKKFEARRKNRRRKRGRGGSDPFGLDDFKFFFGGLNSI